MSTASPFLVYELLPATSNFYRYWFVQYEWVPLSSLPLMEVAAAPLHLNDSAAAGYQLSVHEACDPQSRVLTALRPQTRLHVLATRQLDDGLALRLHLAIAGEADPIDVKLRPHLFDGCVRRSRSIDPLDAVPLPRLCCLL